MSRYCLNLPIKGFVYKKRCTEKINHFLEENNGGLASCLREINPKQTSTLFHCKTVHLENNLIEQNQVVCKFPPFTTDDDRTVKNV